MSETIKSVSEFVSAVLRVSSQDGEQVFYRGHGDYDYENTPQVFRRPGFIENEHRMIRDLIAYHPEDFQNDNTALEQLVRAQHYKLPTRLLDLTRNPLISLFFACEQIRSKTKLKKPPDGAVVIFKINNKNVKSFESDTVSCVTNLCFLSHDEKTNIREYIEQNYKSRRPKEELVKEFNSLDPVKRLHHFIRTEKPYFQPHINPMSLRRFIAVIPKQSNKRIIAQTGAFLAFGTLDTLSQRASSRVTYDKIRVPHDVKKKLLRELNWLHINERSLFPEIEKTSTHIASEYQKRRN